jgi:hypothetical protein
VASGDVTEFQSFKDATSGDRPQIILTYTGDTPPSTVLDAPTGIQGTTRPTISGTSTDPDGDAIQNVYVAVSQGATVVYSANLGAVGNAWSHVPTADLPGGALTVVASAQAGGLGGPASNTLSFTVDRPPVVTAWSAPSGNVSGNRRPVHTFTASDPDGDALELYDVEVYQSVGGAPSGGPVWVASSQVAGISGMTVNHTPGADLPGGPLLARSRVRTGPADLWSAWSAYQAYSIILTTPTVAWISPTADGAWMEYDPPTLANPAASLLTTAVWGKVSDAPPSGQTLTREARGYGYAAAATAWAYDGPPQAPNTPTGGTAQQPFYPDLEPNEPYGSGHSRFIIGASGGGLVDVSRKWRASALEWFGSVYLGDRVSAVSAALTAMGGDYVGWIRAQSSAIDAAASTEPADILAGSGSFETVPLAGWTPHGGAWSAGATSYKIDGANGLIGAGAGVANPYCSSATYQVRPGSTYTLTAGAGRAQGNAAINARVSLAVYDAQGVGISTVAVVLDYTAAAVVGALPVKSGAYTMPANATQAIVNVTLVGSPVAADIWVFDAIKLVPAAPPWRLPTDQGILSEFPAAGAWLGLRARFVQRTADAELHPNPEFDSGMTGWPVYAGPPGGVTSDPTYGNVARFQGNGSSNDVQSMGTVLVVPGATYKVTAILYGPAVSGVLAVCQVDARGRATIFNVVNLTAAAAGWVTLTGSYTVPADGSVATLTPRIGLTGGGAPVSSAAITWIAKASIVGPVPGVAGLDKWSLSWTSLG